ncbi:signal recognition particle SRP19 subunit [Boletus coccyginus]|nr:signal recognition particle SRP19 subunit [Boletus coccyginus]
MARRTAVVEEFDDDTDLPLPSRPLLPNAHGALLEEIGASDDDDSSDPDETAAGSASPSYPQPRPTPSLGPSAKPPSNTITDITPYKKWTCIYPIYIDAKRPYGRGERRIAREKSVWWPLSKDIADATNRLGLGTLHEVNKSHPRDWENPGRVRVQWKKDGRLVDSAIKTKRQLLEMISFQVQRIKPDNIPRPPYTNLSLPVAPVAPTTKAPTSSKGKQPAKSKSGGNVPPLLPQKATRLPAPPQPEPPLASRVSPYSPSLATGVLVDTVKAGMNAQDQGPAGPGTAGMQKGKRKVVRVRG